jgi:excisionase family DNA binding protein
VSLVEPNQDSREPGFSSAPFERVLNTEEAAALLQIHPKTLQRLARQGVIPAFRIGDLWRFRASAMDEWLRSRLGSTSHSCR